MPDRNHVVVGGLCLPLDVEHLESLPVDPGGVIRFDFAYRHIRFAVRYDEHQAGGVVKVVGDAGPMPFTAESPAARAGLNQIMAAANDLLPARFHLSAGRILLGGETAVDRPATAAKLITAVATLVVPAVPYLDLVAIYVRPPLDPTKPGEAALRPEWRRRPRGTAKP